MDCVTPAAEASDTCSAMGFDRGVPSPGSCRKRLFVGRIELISEKQKNDDLDWFAKLQEFGPVSCPHCATNLGVADDTSHLRCAACNQDLVIGLAAMGAGVRPWFASSLLGLSLGFGFCAFLASMLFTQRGPNWEEFFLPFIAFIRKTIYKV